MDADRGRDERRLARGAVLAAAGLVPPTAIAGALAAGVPGAVSALIGVGFVLVLFGVAAALLAWSARRHEGVPLGLLVGAAVGRLAVYAAALAALSRVGWIHRPSLALATVVAIAVTLGIELRLLQRMPRLFWVDAAARPTPVPTAPRSRSL